MRWGFCLAIVLAALPALGDGRAAPTPAAKNPTPEEGEPERPRLRLDESPGLPLLSPFRHAYLSRGSPTAAWRQGRYGRWLRKSLCTVDSASQESLLALSDGEPGFAGVFAKVEAPAVEAAAENDGLMRWPHSRPVDHWFQLDEEQPDAVPGEALAVSEELVPPWLQRVDASLAQALITFAGCGRGGACSVGESFPGDAFVSLWDALSPREPPPPWWVCKERPVRVMRYGREQKQIVLLKCDGSIPDGSLEDLSVLARPPEVKGTDVLPPLPDPNAPRGEWIEGIRLLHPRLLWVLHKIALEFPWRAIYIYSGYRPLADNQRASDHVSLHSLGRALDIKVGGVENEELLWLCHKLADVGCGYYPNGRFVHVDIRLHGSGLWVDASAPGEPSRYVDGWPGVVERGRVIWEPPPKPKPAQ